MDPSHEPGPGPESSVDDRLGLDHERLSGLLEKARRSLENRSPGAAQALAAFETPLRAHMEWEEKHLFPAVGARCSARSQRSIESLEIDHERIRETLGEVQGALARGDWSRSSEYLAQAAIYLRGHNYDEEHGVYVEADALLTPEERLRLLGAFGPSPEGPTP
jgi:hemerythrin-like domain-containing protein